MTREEFLAKIWKPYPTMPLSHNTFGRIVNIADHSVTLDQLDSFLLPNEWRLILKVGDIVSAKVDGKKVLELTLLAPNLAPIPTFSVNAETMKNWSKFLQKIRIFFTDNEFLEVQTPTLVHCPGSEPFLDVFSTNFVNGKKTEKFYLPTSPELHLKKLLSRGYRRIFEIKPCFRNGEISQTHQPEFYMLEWYRAYSNLDFIKKDLIELLEYLSGKKLDFSSVSIAELFAKYLGKNLLPETDLPTLKKWALELGLSVENYTEWDDVFYLIYLEKIEPQLNSANPIFVEKYPPSQAAYARLGNDGWAERFELYWQGLEICNAFHEVNDPHTQEQRMGDDLLKKEKLGKAAVELDSDFFQCLQAGMPPSGGIALGLERLFMALYNIKNINEIKAFPFM